MAVVERAEREVVVLVGVPLGVLAVGESREGSGWEHGGGGWLLGTGCWDSRHVGFRGGRGRREVDEDV